MLCSKWKTKYLLQSFLKCHSTCKCSTASSIDPAYSVTIFNGASSPLTLKIMLGVTLAAVPVVIIYQAWVFWIFRHKVTEEAINNDSHAY